MPILSIWSSTQIVSCQTVQPETIQRIPNRHNIWSPFGPQSFFSFVLITKILCIVSETQIGTIFGPQPEWWPIWLGSIEPFSPPTFCTVQYVHTFFSPEELKRGAAHTHNFSVLSNSLQVETLMQVGSYIFCQWP